MNKSTDELSSNDEMESVDEAKSGGGWKIRLGVLCAMLVFALAGMGFTQASESGAWEYWLFVVVIYAALGLWRSARSAKQTGRSIKKSIARELSHWGALIGFLAVLLLLERREIVNRDSASYFALMLLALSCVMAGVHIDWLLLVVGVVLTIMLVAMATLEQFSVVLWLIMIFVAVLAAGFFYLKSKRGASASEAIE
jgi:hypothetical protein